jgi:hypothetical protein
MQRLGFDGRRMILGLRFLIAHAVPQGLHFCRRQTSRFARLQGAQLQWPHRDPPQPQHLVANPRQNSPDLAITSLRQNKLQLGPA